VRHVFRGIIAGVGVLALTIAPGVQAAVTPVAPPPTSSALVSATNAMLRGSDVTGPLAKGSSGMSMADTLRTGYNAPPGGQDPMPVCAYGAQYTTVGIPLTLAVGFNAGFGAMSQDVYQYASDADAQRAWTTVTSQARSKCVGTFTRGSTTVTLSTTDVAGLPGGPAGLGVLTNGKNAQYSVLHLVGDSIQMLTYAINDGPIAGDVAPAASTLAASLASRWLARATLPTTQDAALTKAESSMLSAADIPANLPVTTPAQGGWSGFTSYLPGTAPIICNARYDIPEAAAAFSVSFGGNGGPLSLPGSLYQQVYSYPTQAAAQQAWTSLRAGVRTCHQKNPAPLSATESVTRQQSGTSALTFGGVPGVWSRSLDSNPPDWSMKSYTIHLLVGNTIQMLTYSTGNSRGGNVPLDQAAVNTLAENLASRWAR